MGKYYVLSAEECHKKEKKRPSDYPKEKESTFTYTQ